MAALERMSRGWSTTTAAELLLLLLLRPLQRGRAGRRRGPGTDRRSCVERRHGRCIPVVRGPGLLVVGVGLVLVVLVRLGGGGQLQCSVGGGRVLDALDGDGDGLSLFLELWRADLHGDGGLRVGRGCAVHFFLFCRQRQHATNGRFDAGTEREARAQRSAAGSDQRCRAFWRDLHLLPLRLPGATDRHIHWGHMGCGAGPADLG